MVPDSLGGGKLCPLYSQILDPSLDETNKMSRLFLQLATNCQKISHDNNLSNRGNPYCTRLSLALSFYKLFVQNLCTCIDRDFDNFIKIMTF